MADKGYVDDKPVSLILHYIHNAINSCIESRHRTKIIDHSCSLNKIPYLAFERSVIFVQSIIFYTLPCPPVVNLNFLYWIGLNKVGSGSSISGNNMEYQFKMAL